MANINKIALRIYGGAIGDSLAKRPFVSLGDVPQKFTPTVPTLVDEQQVWMITHAQDYTLYAASSKRCYTLDDRPGQILICLFLPPQKRLADGHSPLEVLGELMDIFIVQGLRGGKLSNATVDCSPFNSLLEKYRLEDRPMPLPIMAGQAPAAFCVESKAQLDAMMRHSRYSILSSVGRLELGFNCKSTIALIKKGPAKRSETPSQTPSHRDKEPEPVKPESHKPKVVSGGLPLDDEPIVVNNTSWLKKMLKIAAISVGVVFGLFILLGVIGILAEDDGQQVAENDVETITTENDMSNFDQVVDTVATDEAVQDSILDENIDRERLAEERVKSEMEQERAEAKAAMISAVKKKMEEKAKKAEEAKKKEKEKKKEAEDASWQANIRKYAMSCPIQLRLGVRITSIKCNSNSVTFAVNYEELSKYDLDADDKATLIKDRAAIFKKYCSDVPKSVGTTVIQKDKAGRIM